MDRQYTRVSGNLGLWMCPDCGAVAANTRQHDRYHDEGEQRGMIGLIWRLRNGHDRKPVIT